MESYEKVYNNICRLCLKYNTVENMIPLFQNGSVNYYGQAILPFAKISLENEDYLPNSMCKKCLKLLQQCIYFKFLCESSNVRLKQLKKMIRNNVKKKLENQTLFNLNNSNKNTSHKSLGLTNVMNVDIYQEDTGRKIRTDSEGDCFDYSNNNWDIPGKEQKGEDPDKLLDSLEKLVYVKDDLSDEEYVKWPRKVKRISKISKQHRRESYVRNREDRKRKCNVCEKELATYQIYIRHMQKHRGRRFICEYCGKGFKTLADIQVHQVALHGVGPCLQCPHCPFKASKRFDMKEHERIHTGERPFACEKCGLTFRRKELHRKHLIIHSEKTVQCTQCPKKFFKRSDMLEHYNSIHERQYMYMCSECGTMYAKTSTVRRHLVDKHGIPREKQKKVLRVKTNKTV